MKKSSSLEPRLRIVAGEQGKFGPGKAELLRAVAETGSIRAAAGRMEMSYNRAWLLARELNRDFVSPLLDVARGGGAGGGAVLTRTGTEVLQRYERMERACAAATQRDWDALRRLLR